MGRCTGCVRVGSVEGEGGTYAFGYTPDPDIVVAAIC